LEGFGGRQARTLPLPTMPHMDPPASRLLSRLLDG
jgi:hypothetical protein